jgi:hypothetical protein
MKIFSLDTTLSDGTQGESVSFSVDDKLMIAEKLDELGIDYIEGGWPGSNPKDKEFFARAKDLKLRHAKLTAFGATRFAKNSVVVSFANSLSASSDWQLLRIGRTIKCMPAMILCLFRFVRLLCSGHQSIVIENAALRLQLRAFQRTRRRPVLTASDRLFWCALAKIWGGWRGALMFVQPETVVRWQRERFVWGGAT